MNDLQPPVGDHSNAHMPTVPYPLGLSKDWIAQGPVTLIIRDHKAYTRLSQGSYSIMAANGNPIFDVDIPRGSFTGRKTFYSSVGHRLLFHVRADAWNSPGVVYMQNSADEKIAKLYPRISMESTTMDATFKNMVGPLPNEIITLRVEGNFMRRMATINWGDIPVATITGSYGSLGRLVSGLSQYYVQILEGVDIALIAGMVVSMDEHGR